jgi:hypothetical protein
MMKIMFRNESKPHKRFVDHQNDAAPAQLHAKIRPFDSTRENVMA